MHSFCMDCIHWKLSSTKFDCYLTSDCFFVVKNLFFSQRRGCSFYLKWSIDGICNNDKDYYCGDTFNWKYSLGGRKKYGMDGTRTVLKTSLETLYCRVECNFNNVHRDVTSFHRYHATIRVFAIFLCQRNVLRWRKEMENKGESNLTNLSLKNHNVIVSQIDLLPMISIFLFFLFQI